MRRLFLLASAVALFCAPGAVAATTADEARRTEARVLLGSGAEWLGLRRGTGKAQIVRRSGVVWGSVDGRVVIVSPRGSRPSAALSNCERKRRPNRRTVVCSGDRVQFYVNADRRITIRGSRINASGAIRGTLSLKGTNGQYRVGTSDWTRWPRIWRTFRVGD